METVQHYYGLYMAWDRSIGYWNKRTYVILAAWRRRVLYDDY